MAQYNRNKSKKTIKGKYQKQFNFFFTVVCLLLIGVACFSLMNNIGKKQATLEQLTQVQAKHNQAVEKNRQAQQEYHQVQDSEYLEQVARRDYYYSKEGEIIFDLGETETVSEETTILPE
uniref:FtsB family cell division protein n=1 Tax=Globicatella sulfidifaciens TaxID=136093 RepID=UPI0023F356F8|nr:septum formation initiator family protein [Globicatella sulfidifaciens]